MFGIKIISEERYQLEQRKAQNLEKANQQLIMKNVRLEADISDLREQNGKLRSTIAKIKEENEALNLRLKEEGKVKGIKFEDYFEICKANKCDKCEQEQSDCKKYHLKSKTDVICIRRKNRNSFRGKKS